MSEYHSPHRNRVYKRKFNYDEAKRRHESGETLAALAREYGVTEQAVKRAVDPVVYARMHEYVLQRQRERGAMYSHDTCAGCGGRKKKESKMCWYCYIFSRKQH